MTPDGATELAQEIMGPAGLMGYLVGRGSWWPSEACLRDAKRAIGRVMADAYELCRPIWSSILSLIPPRILIHSAWLGVRTSSLILQKTFALSSSV